METVSLFVSVPVASFRVPRAREYFETLPCPPPATVYGMLLALVGETNRGVHEGAEVAIGMLSEPDYSVVLRTVWRVKDRKEGPGLGSNRRPDFQELLTGVHLGIWVRRGVDEKCDLPLAKRLQTAMENPAQISRFGGLSLGESTHLIDEVGPLTEEIGKGQLLLAVGDGDLSLPIWPDHVGSKTRWGQYRLVRFALDSDLPTEAWTAIKRPA